MQPSMRPCIQQERGHNANVIGAAGRCVTARVECFVLGIALGHWDRSAAVEVRPDASAETPYR